eukprot:Pompholyxophrys_punicea_v1_NODE_1012_length_1043_cov_3.427126.p2 type:complete len:136 gc:universal NODE_1012_length_1043_cov_3.427126:229-636(+)
MKFGNDGWNRAGIISNTRFFFKTSTKISTSRDKLNALCVLRDMTSSREQTKSKFRRTAFTPIIDWETCLAISGVWFRLKKAICSFCGLLSYSRLRSLWIPLPKPVQFRLTVRFHKTSNAQDSGRSTLTKARKNQH